MGTRFGLLRQQAAITIEEARLYITASHSAPDAEGPLIDALCHRAALAHKGCDCYSYGLLASGHCDLVVESGLGPCDYLPLIPVIHGAGGRITDWKGGPLGFNSDGRVIAASTKLLLDGVIDALEI